MLRKKELIHSIHSDLEKNYTTISITPENMAIACRKALEQALRFIVEPKFDNKFSLNKLLSDPIVIKELGENIKHADAIRSLGNDQGHEYPNFTPEGAILLYKATNTLLKELGFGIQSEVTSQQLPHEKTEADGRDRIIPPISYFEDHTTSQKLTIGEKSLANKLNEIMPEDFKIYIQPFIFGFRPDILCISKSNLLIFEVKDHKPSESTSEEIKQHELLDFDKMNYYQAAQQITLTRDTLIESHFTTLKREELKRYLKSFIYFSNWSNDEVLRIPKPPVKLLCPENFGDQNILKDIVSQVPASEDIINLLTTFESTWLKFPSTIENKIVPRNEQKTQALTRWQTERRTKFNDLDQYIHVYKALAGTGKSYVIGLRAGNAARSGKDVLVVCRNITLMNSLLIIVSRCVDSPSLRKYITVTHYFRICRKVKVESMIANDASFSISNGSEKEEQGDTLEKISKDTIAILNNSGLQSVSKYDAIYVDEFQDFSADEISALYMLLRPGGELIGFEDEFQNIYRNQRNWKNSVLTEGSKIFQSHKMSGHSWRHSKELVNLFNIYLRSSKDPEERLFIDQELPFTEPFMPTWIQVSPEELVLSSAMVIQWLQSEDPVHPNDIAVLVRVKNRVGQPVVRNLLEAFGPNSVAHTFGNSNGSDERRMKLAFFPTKGKYKVSTVHSFKGLDLDTVILMLDSNWVTDKGDFELFYTGITRAKRRLLVLCSSHEAREQYFNSSWRELSLSDIAVV